MNLIIYLIKKDDRKMNSSSIVRMMIKQIQNRRIILLLINFSTPLGIINKKMTYYYLKLYYIIRINGIEIKSLCVRLDNRSWRFWKSEA